MGRRRLAQATGLGEMVVRQAVERLRVDGTVRVERSGIHRSLSEKGQEIPLLGQLVCTGTVRLEVFGAPREILFARMRGLPVQPAWTLRDRCFRAGGTGLVLLAFSRGVWRFAHNQEPFSKQNKTDDERLTKAIGHPHDSESLVLVSGETLRAAREALWHLIACWEPA